MSEKGSPSLSFGSASITSSSLSEKGSPSLSFQMGLEILESIYPSCLVPEGKDSTSMSCSLKMEGRKWEDMNSDCLVNIFGRLELQSKMMVIPLVCKPWYQAICNPLCWQQLILPRYLRSRTKLIKLVVTRSQRCATLLELPNDCEKEDLIYVAEECPALKTLMLPHRVCIKHKDIIPSLIVKLKNLQVLCLGHTDMASVKQILEVISIHLPNFTRLGLSSGNLDHETAIAIVSLVPKLKGLVINQVNLQKENLLVLLQGCKELEYLEVRNCFGIDDDDAEILKHSSGIKNFRCDSSKAMRCINYNDPGVAEVMKIDIFDIFDDIEEELGEKFFDDIEEELGDNYEWDG